MKKLIPILLILLLVASCKQVEYVTIPVKEVHTEYLHDSVSHTDTVYHFNTIFTRGDTVFVRDSVVNTINTTYLKEHYTCDTVADTVQLKLQAELIEAQQKVVERQYDLISELESDVSNFKHWFIVATILLLLSALPWIVKAVKYLNNGK